MTRNDRIIAVCSLSLQYKTIEQPSDPPEQTLSEIESFFKQYNTLADKQFISLGWKDSKEAIKQNAVAD